MDEKLMELKRMDKKFGKLWMGDTLRHEKIMNGWETWNWTERMDG